MATLLDNLLEAVYRDDASDLHLRVGAKPRYRVAGELVQMEGTEVLTFKAMMDAMNEMLDPEQLVLFDNLQDIDVAATYHSVRVRANCFHDYWGPAISIRKIPDRIPTLEQLGLPATLGQFAHLRSGLVLITGATGSGKSSTLATILNMINCAYAKHIVILEDPIEYLHQSRESVVHQRGMHVDFPSFSDGLQSALRQDPDVLLVGELRDLETIRLALSAAEMGMLVFSTLHTLGACESIDRIYDVFPAAEQPEIRTMVAHSLQGVVSQVLLKTMDGQGRVPATEVLMCTTGVRNLIREGKTQEITNYIQSGKSAGMHTLADSLERLVKEGKVGADEALSYCGGRSERLEKILRRQQRAAPRQRESMGGIGGMG